MQDHSSICSISPTSNLPAEDFRTSPFSYICHLSQIRSILLAVRIRFKSISSMFLQNKGILFIKSDNTNSIGPEVLADGFCAGLMEYSCSQDRMSTGLGYAVGTDGPSVLWICYRSCGFQNSIRPGSYGVKKLLVQSVKYCFCFLLNYKTANNISHI